MVLARLSSSIRFAREILFAPRTYLVCVLALFPAAQVKFTMTYFAARLAIRMATIPPSGPTAELVYRFGYLAVGASFHLHGAVPFRSLKVSTTTITSSQVPNSDLDGGGFEAGLVQVYGSNKVKGPLSRAFQSIRY